MYAIVCIRRLSPFGHLVSRQKGKIQMESVHKIKTGQVLGYAWTTEAGWSSPEKEKEKL